MIRWMSVGFIFFYTLFAGVHNVDYSDLQALGLACPKRDQCAGYKNNTIYLERSCECDSACITYNDCCIDFRKRSSGQRVSQNNMNCLQYGENVHSGVYGISKCDVNWNGPKQVKEKCEGPTDLSDLVSATPVTSTTKAVTYKNLYCAECNNAEKDSLKFFLQKLACEGSDNMSEEKIMENLSFNQKKKRWGYQRVNEEGKGIFSECQVIFDVPVYLNRSVRFCRANIISKCARDFTRPLVRKACNEYMAVVFDNSHAYRNPHCAICNHKTASDLSCTTDLLGRKRPFSFSALIDINRNESTSPSCAANQIYDPYFKKCKRLACALPGYKIQDGKCVPPGS